MESASLKENGQTLQKALKELADQKFALGQHAMVSVTDREGNMTYINNNFCEIAKYPREELLGKDYRFLNSGYHSKEFWKDLWTTIRRGDVWKGHMRNKAKDDTVFWINTTIVPFLDEQRKPSQYMAISEDITDRKNSEGLLVKLNKQLKESNVELRRREEDLKSLDKMKTNFLSTISHELRTPLTSIIGNTKLIMQEFTQMPDSDKMDFLKTVAHQGEGLLNLINDILDVAKAEAGSLDIKREDNDIGEIINASVEDIRILAVKKGITISKKILTKETTAFADEIRLRQVLVNLLSNAIKFTPEAGKISVTVEDYVHSKDVLLVSVEDNGDGIPQDKLHILFDRFAQIDNSPSRKSGGTGLGLTIVKEIVTLHEGKVWVQSEPDKGTVFRFTILKGKRTARNRIPREKKE